MNETRREQFEQWYNAELDPNMETYAEDKKSHWLAWQAATERAGRGDPMIQQIDVQKLQTDPAYWGELKAPKWAKALALQDMKREIWWSPEKWAPVDLPNSTRTHGSEWGQYGANECLILAVRPAAQPPAPAVPEEMGAGDALALFAVKEGEQQTFADGWNACRDAMLNAATQPTGGDES